MKIIEGNLALKGNEKIAIINARFNHIITDRLVEGAKDAFLRHGGNEANLSLILVPGAFEIPMALEKALASGKFHTKHFRVFIKFAELLNAHIHAS
ncbi:MAG: 6,7-dimethyl-8-ribityllumazine synthase [Aggregatibacter sp.]|uniref:6,7-dimethyl-8-ribityllumazine synthase n=1 Tax=Aggregatibacter sp. TaxID=1872413 RepID=UPI003622A558